MATKQTKKPKASVNIKIEDVGGLVKKVKDHAKSSKCGPCGGGLYFLGALGAAIYYISTATGFWMGVLGVLKAIVWPAFLVFALMKYLGM